jgi:very-short-patch-repair endonuclease
VVGDDKQVSPSDVARKETDILYLRDKHLKALPYGHLFLPGSSIYDLCNTVFATDVIRLREHFRCVEPIIQFSNKQFYEGELRPIRIPKPSERLDPPLIDIYVPGGYREGSSKINKPEARAIVAEIARITSDKRFDKRSIGVVSLLGFEQAQHIQNLLLSELGEDKILDHKIQCGDAKFFQGKEADIVMISMVAAGRIQAQTGRIYEQRFNVAASRARDRLYVFRSFERADITESDLRARLVDHFTNPSLQGCEEIKELRDLCESDFERDVFDELTGRGYRVRPQVHVGNYRIDLVVEGLDDARLAVELDGDKYHGIERWLEDISRQRTLERMGWIFWRCWGSNYISEKDECLNDLIAKLDTLKIDSIGLKTKELCGVSEHRTFGEFDTEILDDEVEPEAVEEPDEEIIAQPEPIFEDGDEPIKESPEPVAENLVENGHQSESYVQINDTVTYSFIDNPDELKMVQIVRGQGSVSEGIICHTSPIAQTLLGAFLNEQVTEFLPTGARELTVIDIVKS